MYEIKTEVVLNAPIEKVWAILTDLETWSEWNPFIIQASGDATVGSKLTNTLVNNEKPMVFQPVVTELEINKKFAWLGSAFAGGFKGRHYFALEAINHNQVKLTHGETFFGWLVWLIFPLIKQQTLQGFERMNEALKLRIAKVN